jgi:hypothetical protein
VQRDRRDLEGTDGVKLFAAHTTADGSASNRGILLIHAAEKWPTRSAG